MQIKGNFCILACVNIEYGKFKELISHQKKVWECATFGRANTGLYDAHTVAITPTTDDVEVLT